jgi:beta-hydroxylase
MAATFPRRPGLLPRRSSPARSPLPKRPLIIRIGKKLRRKADALIERSSLVSNAPILDSRDFAWTSVLRDNWQTILREARAVLHNPEAVPLLDEVSPDHTRIAPPGKWRSFFLRGYGCDIAENMARCPQTTALVRNAPGLNSAFFSVLAPGAHIPPHRGVTKGLVTCHLGLIVPDGNVRMRVDRQFVRWAEGETLVFDDTYEHEVWNDTDETRVVLLIQFARPLRAPGKWLADLFLWGVKHTAFVREARDNVSLWARNMPKIEEAHELDGF